MELSEPVETVADLAEYVRAWAERDPAMPVTVLFRAEDTDYERAGGLYWARSDIAAVAERGGIFYLVAPDPQAVAAYEYAPDVTEAFDARRKCQRSDAAARVVELEAQLAQARAEFDSCKETTYRGFGID